MTLVSKPSLVPAAMALGFSLRVTSTSHPLLCLVTQEVGPADRASLWALYDLVVDIPLVADTGQSWRGDMFTKIRAFEFDMYSIIVVLDADMLVLRNVDELFDCARVDPTLICASADMGLWQTTLNGPTVNTGVMVLTPNVTLADELRRGTDGWDWEVHEITLLPEGRLYYPWSGRRVYLGPKDQALVNTFFGPDRVVVLPHVYNYLGYTLSGQFRAPRGFLHVDEAEVRIVHFASVKPWAWDGDGAGQLGRWFGLWREMYRESMRAAERTQA